MFAFNIELFQLICKLEFSGPKIQQWQISSQNDIMFSVNNIVYAVVDSAITQVYEADSTVVQLDLLDQSTYIVSSLTKLVYIHN